MIKFTITGNPISSKNSIRSGITKDGRNYTYTKKDVKQYRDSALRQLKEQWYYTDPPILFPANVSFKFYCKDNRKRDLINLIQQPADLLQQAGIIENDCLIQSLDGSRIMEVDKLQPRTEIEITMHYSDGNIGRLTQAITKADLITVTTDSLAETYSKYNSNVKILPNMIEVSEFDKVKRYGFCKTCGWYSSGIRFEEMRSILEGWIPEGLNLFLAGSKIFENFKYKDKVVVDTFKPDNLPYILSNIDIGLIPLSLCRFNDGKSDLKGLEMGIMEIPFIASPTAPYREMAKHNNGMFLINKRRDWTKYINLLVNDSKLREQMGRSAREYALTRSIEKNIHLWTESYK